MKATLEFNLPDEKAELHLATRAPTLFAALVDIKTGLRLHLKHGNPEDDRRVLEELRDGVYDALLEFGE